MPLDTPVTIAPHLKAFAYRSPQPPFVWAALPDMRD